MIESYAFLAMFVVQILVMSVLLPLRFIKYARAKAREFPAERFAQLHPGVDHRETLERHVSRFRVLNLGISLLGLWPLIWFAGYTARPDWDDGPVEALVTAYFMVQSIPFLVIAFFGIRYGKLLRSLLSGKRSAVLERRGLFDFVSPLAVFLALLLYLLLVAYTIYIAQDPFPGFAGPYINIGMFTLGLAAMAFVIHKLLYGKNVNPHETHADRMYGIGLGVRLCVYAAIVSPVGTAINFTLVRLDLQRWEPFAQSTFLVFTALLCFMAFSAPPRRPAADGLGASPVV